MKMGVERMDIITEKERQGEKGSNKGRRREERMGSKNGEESK